MSNLFHESTPKEIKGNPFALLDSDWGLLSCRSDGKSNAMTVSWGGLGVLWNKPVATVYVRPTRYTFELLEEEAYFSLCFFTPEQKDALKLCGSKSGREMDKISAAGLTEISDIAPYVEEASLVLLCKKIYTDCINPENFLEETLDSNYPKKDYHKIYIGEIVKVLEKEFSEV